MNPLSPAVEVMSNHRYDDTLKKLTKTTKCQPQVVAEEESCCCEPLVSLADAWGPTVVYAHESQQEHEVGSQGAETFGPAQCPSHNPVN